MKIQESAENYLETILMIRERKQIVRSIDIVRELNFSKPSVSVAMKNLKEAGYITMDETGRIYLTEQGEALATKIYDRHVKVSDWLTSIGVPRDIAEADACKMEHVISEETFEAFKRLAEKSL
ncbi:metal-dependent transcriptional regulator [Bullifex porci]|uniref:metal-dependent transcriptional regulator n=1 Tax=Bullifex porci TaxID=2606638 RepID=UPI0023F3FF6C|nr:metal-dependent transcriptional regulator [Bullifex porci]MDD7254991.1 metal-dependent transcriptional regulator [Bullifex porci]MDD7589357.1 metal-dependent transcriptional regulator [Bullifex porci]MDY2741725.1 metal-dependent transcriptional regulator [Bullifex porci]